MSHNSATCFTCFTVPKGPSVSWHILTCQHQIHRPETLADVYWIILVPRAPVTLKIATQLSGTLTSGCSLSSNPQVHLESGQRFLKNLWLPTCWQIQDLYVSMSPPFLQWNPKSARDLNKMPADFLPQIMRQLQFINDTTIASTPSLLFPRLVLQMAKLR